jgi:hypothetical protein
VRGWEALVHRVADPEGEAGWPAKGRYGPPRTLAWWQERRENESSKQRALWSAVLVRVRGPLADEMLEGEAGLWLFEDEGSRVDALELVVQDYDYDVEVSELCPDKDDEDNDYEIPEAVEEAVLRGTTPERRWIKDGKGWVVKTSKPEASFSIESWDDYAASLEHVQFEKRAAEATK